MPSIGDHMLAHPNPPFLELGFFLDSNAPLLELVEARVRLGSMASAAQVEAVGPDISYVSTSVRIRDTAELRTLARDESKRIVRVAFDGGDSSPELAVLLEPATQPTGARGVALWTSAEPLEPPNSWDDEARAIRYGHGIHATFLRLVADLTPAYAAISVEHGLPSPASLFESPDPVAFTDAYISRNFIPGGEMDTIRRFAESIGAYTEVIADGLYTSCSRWFNPSSAAVDDASAQSLSLTISKSLGRSQL